MLKLIIVFFFQMEGRQLRMVATTKTQRENLFVSKRIGLSSKPICLNE